MPVDLIKHAISIHVLTLRIGVMLVALLKLSSSHLLLIKHVVWCRLYVMKG